ncbi:hypothetical protein G6F37_004119 [Rhizopus arrhizus]|nr:hypothetical protein G6F38_001093 [Rhizopus arrhizus]KAG1160292.1 hypothetical protein G6F37_004119 [Rhizopus arrhizus]
MTGTCWPWIFHLGCPTGFEIKFDSWNPKIPLDDCVPRLLLWSKMQHRSYGPSLSGASYLQKSILAMPVIGTMACNCTKKSPSPIDRPLNIIMPPSSGPFQPHIRFLDTSPCRLYPDSVGQSVEANLISLSAVQEIGHPIQDVSKIHKRQPKRLHEKKGKKIRSGYYRPKETTVYVHYTLTATKTVTIGNDYSRERDEQEQGRGRDGGRRFDFGQLFDYERVIDYEHVLAAPTQTMIPAGMPSVAGARAMPSSFVSKRRSFHFPWFI